MILYTSGIPPKANYHTHTTWCDGKDSPEAVVEAAIGMGFAEIGFSSHAMLPGDPLDWPLTKAKLSPYIEDIGALKRKYAGKIRVLCAVEADYIPGVCFPDSSVYPKGNGIDYIIGSVHFVVAPDGEWVFVDKSPESLVEGINSHFGGSVTAYVKAYFAAQREMVRLYDFDVIGHPDLIRKFDGKLNYLDERAPWYVEELEKTADAFARSGKIVEINTGAISRGWMDDAYPSSAFRAMLRSRGIKMILSADAHSASTIACAFDRPW